MSDAASEANSWLIKRNCSAGPGQLAVVFGSLVAVSFAFGVGFAAFGLWMVLPFVGIELIAVGAAFLCYGWHAADFERIEIASDTVFVEHVDGDRRKQWKFDPRASHVQIESHGRRWGKRVRVYLLAPGTKLELGRYLLDPRRLQLGRELSGSLMRARMGAR
ncbi:MAG: DUF2244 domain-containing protein [Pseudomonadota bacterium]|nr:DUF2244 domain-containing protein [Pseudomonadota bacterium]